MDIFVYYPYEMVQQGSVEECMRKILSSEKMITLIREIESRTGKAVRVPTLTILESMTVQPTTTKIPYICATGVKDFLVERRTRAPSEEMSPAVSLSYGDMFINNAVNNINLIFLYKTNGKEIIDMFSDNNNVPNDVEKRDSILLLDEKLSRGKFSKLVSMIKKKFPADARGDMSECMSIDEVINLITDSDENKVLQLTPIWNPHTRTLSLYSKGQITEGFIMPSTIEFNNAPFIAEDVHNMINLGEGTGAAMQAHKQLAFHIFSTVENDDTLTLESASAYCASLGKIGPSVMSLVRGMAHVKESALNSNLNVNAEDSDDFLSEVDKRALERSGSRQADIVRAKVDKSILEGETQNINNLQGVNNRSFKLHATITKSITNVMEGGAYGKKNHTPEEYLYLLCTGVFRPALEEYLAQAFKSYSDVLVISIVPDDDTDSEARKSKLKYGLSFLGGFKDCISKYDGIDNEGRLQTSFPLEEEYDSLELVDNQITQVFTNLTESIRKADNIGEVDVEQTKLYSCINKFLVEDYNGNKKVVVFNIKFQMIDKNGIYYNTGCYQYFENPREANAKQN